MMRVRICTALPIALLLALTAGCAGDSRQPEYYGAVESKALEIPEGLAKPTSSAALVISAPPMPLSGAATEAKPPRITSTTSGLDSNSSFRWSAQGLYLLVDDTPESVERRLRLVIERAGMKRVRVDEKGVYRFDYYQTFGGEDEGFLSRLAFWNRNEVEDYSGAYQVYTEPDGQQTRIYIKYADGTDCEPDAAEHLLEVVRSRLG
jgi:uncharacterized lipoprotein